MNEARAWYAGFAPVHKGGHGSGHCGHHGIPGQHGGSLPGPGLGGIVAMSPEDVAKRDLGISVSGTPAQMREMLQGLGWSLEKLEALNERQLRMLATKRAGAPVGDWLETQGDYVVVYHGTSSAAMDKYAPRENGIPARASAFKDVGQEAGVFVVPNYNARWAEYWANRAAERDGGRPIILEMRLSKEALRVDPGNERDFLYSKADVQSSEIIGQVELKSVRSKDFQFHVTVPDPRGGDNNVYVKDTFAGR